MKWQKLLCVTMLISLSLISHSDAKDRVGLGFIYGSSGSYELVDRTNGAINQVSPTCLDISSDGNLIVTGELSHYFVDKMHEKGMIVTPFLSNHWARARGRKAIQNADKLSQQIAEVVAEYNLDGVNVDIENLTGEDRDDLTNLVRHLREKMPSNKILTVSVATNPNNVDYGWQASYDYEKLGKYSDYLFLMTYDEHGQGGKEGPVASIGFVEESIKYALNYVPKEKIVMGIPFFGRYWKEENDDISGELLESGEMIEVQEIGENIEVSETVYKGGEAIVIANVQGVLEKNNGSSTYDEEFQTPRAEFTVDSEAQETKINGSVLEEGNYVIWYENEDSLKAKLSLVNSYDLLGVGVWSLGQENKEIWDFFGIELNRGLREKEELERIEKERAYAKRLEIRKTLQENGRITLIRLNKDKIKYLEVDKNQLDILKDSSEDIFGSLKKYIVEEEPHLHESFKDNIEYIKVREMIAKDNKKFKLLISRYKKELALGKRSKHLYRFVLV